MVILEAIKMIEFNSVNVIDEKVFIIF